MKEKTPYLEAMRYIDNAKKILSTQAGKKGDHYSDSKYVKMACNTAYAGVLLALEHRFDLRRMLKKGGRLDVDDYRRALAGVNRSMLTTFNDVYHFLHLSGGYDGALHVSVSQTGIKEAEKLINWTKPYTDKEPLLAAA